MSDGDKTSPPIIAEGTVPGQKESLYVALPLLLDDGEGYHETSPANTQNYGLVVRVYIPSACVAREPSQTQTARASSS